MTIQRGNFMTPNLNPTADNPLIDRNPPSDRFDEFFRNLISKLRRDTGVQNIYGGYNQIEKPPSMFDEIGSCTALGLNTEEISQLLEKGKDPYLFFVAVPLNDMDSLVEKPDMDIWDFEENYLKKYIPAETFSTGRILIHSESVKLRTIRFVMYL